jgi:hypothetical protein
MWAGGVSWKCVLEGVEIMFISWFHKRSIGWIDRSMDLELILQKMSDVITIKRNDQKEL